MRYEWRLVNACLGFWVYYDKVKHETVIETTTIGKAVYERLGFK